MKKTGWGSVFAFVLLTIMWWCLALYSLNAMQTQEMELWLLVLVGILSLWFLYNAIRNTVALVLTLAISIWLAFKLCSSPANTQYYITETDRISDLIKLRNVNIVDNEEYEETDDEAI